MTIIFTLFGMVIYTTITGSFVAFLIYIIKTIIGKKINLRVHHTLWLIVLLRLLLPYTVESNISIFNVFPNINESNIKKDTTPKTSPFSYTKLRENNFYWNSTNKLSKINYNKKSIKSIVFSQYNIFIILSLSWFAGIIIISLIIIIEKIKFRFRLSDFEEICNEKIIKIVNKNRNLLNIKQTIPVYTSNYIKSPCISGVFRPKIFLPKDIMETFSISQIEHILLHEIIHFKRKDLFYNFFSIVTLIIHWFNPVVWFIIKKMRFERELACDSYALEVIGEEKCISYGQTLIDTIQRYNKRTSYLLNMTGIFGTKREIERRIIMIKLFKNGTYKYSLLAIALIAIISAVTLTSNVNASDNVEKYETYRSFGGLTLDELSKKLNEQPIKKSSTDDTLYVFKQENIEVGLSCYENNDLFITQISSLNKNTTYKGLKVGDSYDKFKDVFGKPYWVGKDSKVVEFGDKYNYISVIFDAKTMKATNIYICNSKDGSRG
jgi:bla regulator protein blaR1